MSPYQQFQSHFNHSIPHRFSFGDYLAWFRLLFLTAVCLFKTSRLSFTALAFTPSITRFAVAEFPTTCKIFLAITSFGTPVWVIISICCFVKWSNLLTLSSICCESLLCRYCELTVRVLRAINNSQNRMAKGTILVRLSNNAEITTYQVRNYRKLNGGREVLDLEIMDWTYSSCGYSM